MSSRVGILPTCNQLGEFSSSASDVTMQIEREVNRSNFTHGLYIHALNSMLAPRTMTRFTRGSDVRWIDTQSTIDRRCGRKNKNQKNSIFVFSVGSVLYRKDEEVLYIPEKEKTKIVYCFT
jgi:hypothetical protein